MQGSSSSVATKKSARLPTDVIPIHYSLYVRPLPIDPSNTYAGFDRFVGRVSIDVLYTAESDRVVLNCKKLNIKGASIMVTGGPSVECKGLHMEEESSQLQIVWKHSVSPGTKATVIIEYEGICGDDSTGLYKNSYAGGTRKGLASQLQSTDARKFFPCFDEPAMKATFDLTAQVPPNYVVLFNTPRKSQELDRESGTEIHKFDVTPKMSTYLLAFFVGEVDYVEAKTNSGVTIKVWTPVGEKDLGRFPLSVAVKTIEFFEDYYGIKYPMQKLDMIGLDSFLYGGMENWGLITYSSGMFYITEKDSFVKRKRCAYVVAHECAHMWFGNLVTMKWWHDLWLNEGFATYAGWQAVRAIYPEWDVPCILFTDEICRALQADAFVKTHAVEIDPSIDDADEISSLVDSITYSKGLACLILAADVCGEKAFQLGVQRYLKEFAYKNAESQDLFRHLDGASGKAVGKIIGKWTSMVGFPLVSVSRDGDTLHMEQRRFLANGDSVRSHPWPVPIKLSWHKGGKTELLFDKEEQSFEIPLRAQDAPFLLLNAGQMAMYRVKYSPGLWHELLSNIDLLQHVDRLALLDNIYALAEAKLASASDFIQLVMILADDDNPQVASVVLQRLGKFASVWKSANNGRLRESITRLYNRVATTYLTKFGDEPRPQEAPMAGTVRDMALRALVGDKTSAVHAKFLGLLPQWEEYRNSPWLPLIFIAAAASGDETAYQTLLGAAAALKSDSAKHVLALSCATGNTDATKLTALLAPLESGSMFSVWCSIDDKAFLWAYLRSNWAKLHAVSGGSANTFGRMVAHIFDNLSDLGLIGEMNTFFASIAPNQFQAIKQYVEQSKEKINLNYQWVERDAGTVEAVLGLEKGSVLSSASKGKAASVPSSSSSTSSSGGDDGDSHHEASKWENEIFKAVTTVVVVTGVTAAVGFAGYWLYNKFIADE